MQYLDYICPAICCVFCIIHFIVGLINSKLQNKKIEKICDKCLTPLVEGEKHECSVSTGALCELAEYITKILMERENRG
ncbi:hypothetical protein [Dipodfec virus UOA04_Rod_751]|nr:hypothetical protein [Dipodfec virus UOA04_Rod_751]